jgi:hypothetical protein
MAGNRARATTKEYFVKVYRYKMRAVAGDGVVRASSTISALVEVGRSPSFLRHEVG